MAEVRERWATSDQTPLGELCCSDAGPEQRIARPPLVLLSPARSLSLVCQPYQVASRTCFFPLTHPPFAGAERHHQEQAGRWHVRPHHRLAMDHPRGTQTRPSTRVVPIQVSIYSRGINFFKRPDHRLALNHLRGTSIRPSTRMLLINLSIYSRGTDQRVHLFSWHSLF